MAEFCLDCWNRINGTQDTQWDWVLSEEPDLCEGCGQWKRVIVAAREAQFMHGPLCLKLLVAPGIALLVCTGCWHSFRIERQVFSYGETEYHAPCLMSLDTGEIGELRVYDMEPFDSKIPAENQPSGTFSFVNCAGIMGRRDTSNHTCQIAVPDKNFVLLDLYDLERVQTYPIYDGASYEIREYNVTVTSVEGLGNLCIQVKGNI